jgi:hypothetical protein
MDAFRALEFSYKRTRKFIEGGFQQFKQGNSKVIDVTQVLKAIENYEKEEKQFINRLKDYSHIDPNLIDSSADILGINLAEGADYFSLINEKLIREDGVDLFSKLSENNKKGIIFDFTSKREKVKRCLGL